MRDQKVCNKCYYIFPHYYDYIDFEVDDGIGIPALMIWMVITLLVIFITPGQNLQLKRSQTKPQDILLILFPCPY